MNFFDVVKSIAEFICPMDQPDKFVFKLKTGDEEEDTQLAVRFPKDVWH